MSNEFKGVKFSTMAMPWIPVGHPDYRWTNHTDTDVTRTWSKYGWKPMDVSRPITDGAVNGKVGTPAQEVQQLRKGSRATRRRADKVKMDLRTLLDQAHQP
jgi:hypothetical protein